jgi:hypothetical protein
LCYLHFCPLYLSCLLCSALHDVGTLDSTSVPYPGVATLCTTFVCSAPEFHMCYWMFLFTTNEILLPIFLNNKSNFQYLYFIIFFSEENWFISHHFHIFRCTGYWSKNLSLSIVRKWKQQNWQDQLLFQLWLVLFLELDDYNISEGCFFFHSSALLEQIGFSNDNPLIVISANRLLKIIA